MSLEINGDGIGREERHLVTSTDQLINQKGGGRNSEKRSHLICISGRKGGLKGVVPWEQETSHLLRHILMEFDQNLPSLKQIETVNFVEQIALYSPILKSVWLSNKIEMILTNLWFE